MTPEDLAALHARAFTQSRPWRATEFADLCAASTVHLTYQPDAFAWWRAIAGEAELLTIAVDPDVQRQGRGQRLMQAWMQEAAHTCNRVFLEVAEDNRPALGLYTACGFQSLGRRPDYYARADGSHVAAIVMSKSI